MPVPAPESQDGKIHYHYNAWSLETAWAGALLSYLALHVFPLRENISKPESREDPAKVAPLLADGTGVLITGLFSLAHGDEIGRKTHFSINTLLFFAPMEKPFFFPPPLSLRLRQHFGFSSSVFLLVIVKTVSQPWASAQQEKSPVQYFHGLPSSWLTNKVPGKLTSLWCGEAHVWGPQWRLGKPYATAWKMSVIPDTSVHIWYRRDPLSWYVVEFSAWWSCCVDFTIIIYRIEYCENS